MHRAIAALTLAFAPVTRAVPGLRLGIRRAGRISPTRAARRGSRGRSVCPIYAQREAIEQARDEILLDRPDLEPLLDKRRDEPFFTKTLENVQGEERDTITISIGYGKTAEGSLSMNFGPINQDGGWRRLNVIITRAKWQTILVTSIRSPELAGVNPLNRGATALRNFIAYGKRQGELLPQPAGPTTGESNDFEDAVPEARSESAGWASNAMAPRIIAPRPPETGASYGIWSCGTSVGAFTACGLRTGSGIRIRPSS